MTLVASPPTGEFDPNHLQRPRRRLGLGARSGSGDGVPLRRPVAPPTIYRYRTPAKRRAYMREHMRGNAGRRRLGPTAGDRKSPKWRGQPAPTTAAGSFCGGLAALYYAT
jgi:hypothetical protein